MKEKLGNFFGGLVVLISYVGSCFAISRFFDFLHFDYFVSGFLLLVYTCGYWIVFHSLSTGSKSDIDKAYKEGFADGQVEQEERNLLSVAGAAQSQYKRGYDEGFAAGTKDAQARVEQVYAELLRMQKNPYTGIPITTQAQYYQYLEQKKAAAAARQTQNSHTKEENAAE